ncbi:hypothetical protein WICPIJ_010085 [Wickerhamomyces pijperi]|uniref:Uncharacterized protein n=1 Tax=Wickerhamomyces pijperi TaxID=599730 RepID=A0A9P8PHA4_WICPI|nr:hypothetical protein WICPIJ_010085 [Wickerhamomyces pijperi]
MSANFKTTYGIVMALMFLVGLLMTSSEAANATGSKVLMNCNCSAVKEEDSWAPKFSNHNFLNCNLASLNPLVMVVVKSARMLSVVLITAKTWVKKANRASFKDTSFWSFATNGESPLTMFKDTEEAYSTETLAKVWLNKTLWSALDTVFRDFNSSSTILTSSDSSADLDFKAARKAFKAKDLTVSLEDLKDVMNWDNNLELMMDLTKFKC